MRNGLRLHATSQAFRNGAASLPEDFRTMPREKAGATCWTLFHYQFFEDMRR